MRPMQTHKNTDTLLLILSKMHILQLFKYRNQTIHPIERSEEEDDDSGNNNNTGLFCLTVCEGSWLSLALKKSRITTASVCAISAARMSSGLAIRRGFGGSSRCVWSSLASVCSPPWEIGVCEKLRALPPSADPYSSSTPRESTAS